MDSVQDSLFRSQTTVLAPMHLSQRLYGVRELLEIATFICLKKNNMYTPYLGHSFHIAVYHLCNCLKSQINMDPK